MPDAAKKLIEQIAETERPLFSLSNALFAAMTQLQPGDDVQGPHIIGALRSSCRTRNNASIDSAKSFFSFRFSSSRPFSFRASETSMPPNLQRHL